MIHTIIEIVATVVDVVFLAWFVSCFHAVSVWKKPTALVWIVLFLVYQLFVDAVLPAFDLIALIGVIVVSVGYSTVR